jgi:serine/threonine protein phosphatase PrpC
MIRSASASHKGLVRTDNEDVVVVENAHALFAVVDGFGGAPAAAKAAALAATTLVSFVDTSRRGAMPNLPWPYDDRLSPEANRLSMAVRGANAAVHGGFPGQAGRVGATVAALALDDRFANVVHVGDARAYRVRGNEMALLTRDHTRATRLVDEGKLRPEDVRFHPEKKGLTLALGLAADVRPAARVEQVMVGDLFLLCSDGLTDMLSEKRILEIITNVRSLPVAERLPRAAALLIDAANGAGGEDNTSVVLVEISL